MTRVLTLAAALAMLACLGIAGLATAQPTLDMNLLNNGKPAPDVTIAAVINNSKQVVGTTGTRGQISIDTSRLNIGKGTEVTVWIKTCEDGRVEVILVPAGEQGECTSEDAQAGEGCGCRRAGVIIWGDGPVTIDVGRGTVSQVTSGGSPWRNWTVGAGLDLRQMVNLEDVLLEVPGATDASSTTWAPGIQVLTEWQLGSWFKLGLDASYAAMDTEVTFPEGVQTGDLDYYEIGGNLKVGPNRGRIRPYATAGLYRTWNKANFALGGETEYRLHKTRRDGLGAGLDWYPRPNLALRFEGLYSSTFEDHDADEHVRYKGALIFHPFSQ